jgi:hypothetical protein
MKVLFWAGYQRKLWDGNTTVGLAGTEAAIKNIAEALVNFGYEVVVSGEVLHSGKIRGVEWCNIEHIHDLHFNQFDFIIGASYMHFALEFKNYTKAKKIYWAHNTSPFEYWNGKPLEKSLVKEVLSDKGGWIDETVTLTDWHAGIWSSKYDWESPAIIGNGIDRNTFIGHPPKQLNSFIWSSAINRGLIDLLKNWPRIKGVLSDATLNVYWPEYSSNWSEMDWIKEHQSILEGIGVTFHGPVSKEVLHKAMLKSDYWCYLTGYEETYCITALEMQYAKVLPITTKTAALKETVHSGIILENDETKWDRLVQTLKEMSPSLKEFAKNKAHNWAKMQTWNERAYDWKNLFDTLSKEKSQ